MRWSKTMELYPLAMQTSVLGVLRSISSVEATLEGAKLASELNHTPTPVQKSVQAAEDWHHSASQCAQSHLCPARRLRQAALC